MSWRLGLDLGVASIGWVALRLDTEGEAIGVMDGGVRLFSDGRNPKNNEPFNVRRRTQRGIRNNKARQRMRQRSVEAWLVNVGLLQSFKHDVRSIDPYQARSDAAEGPVSAEVIARACMHIAKSRGFKSNRKTDSSEESASDFKTKLATLKDALQGKTLGQWQHERQQKELRLFNESKTAKTPAERYVRQGVKFRGDSAFYPTRVMLQDEFHVIRDVQAAHHDLSADDWNELERRIFFQRKLRKQERGKCSLFPNEDRALAALPSSEAFRVEQQLSNLRQEFSDRTSAFLTPQQRESVRQKLQQQKTLSFSAILKMKEKGSPVFPDVIGFNLATIANDKLPGCTTRLQLTKTIGEDLLSSMSIEEQDDLVELLIEANEDEEIYDRLRDKPALAPFGEALAALSFSSGTLNLSSKATRALAPLLEAGMNYADATANLTDDDGNPLHHSRRSVSKLEADEPLPYYGAVLTSSVIGGKRTGDPFADPEGFYGRIANPTVHVALNQVRKVVNALITMYGHPAEIHIELTRQLNAGTAKRNEILRNQAKNRKENDRLRDLAGSLGVPDPSRTDLQKLKLWEQLNGKDPSDRRCVYTGRRIAGTDVLTSQVEIEHILPYSRTLDDRISNKTLAFKDANALKGNQTPHEAFGSDTHASKGMVWTEILDRISRLHPATAWRFASDAMERFHKLDGGFVERSLNDTGYLARASKSYLELLTGFGRVVVVTGRHTANLRHDWGLNKLLRDGDDKDQKNRGDHRHHMIDAFVIAMTTRSVLQRMAKDAKYSDLDHRHQRGVFPLPDSQREQLQDLVDNCLVSVKPDHGTQGQFFDETAYGLKPGPKDMDPERNASVRKSVIGLRQDPEKVFGWKLVEGICDPSIQNALGTYLLEHKNSGKTHKELLEAFQSGPLCDIVEQRGIRRLKVRIKDQSVQPIPSAPYKGYAVNQYAFADVWYLPPNKKQKKPTYKAIFVELFKAKDILSGQASAPRPDHPGAKRVMRLFKNDIVSIEEGGKTALLRVYGFSATNNKLDVRSLNAGDAPRKYQSINQLGAINLKKVRLNAAGKAKGGNL